jgi:hypothetical protein
MRAFALIFACGCATDPGVALSVTVTGIEGRELEHEWLVTVHTDLENAGPTAIEGHTNFHSALDGTSLVITDASGHPIVRQSYVMHQSPYAEDSPVLVQPGHNREDIVFPISIALPPGARAHLVGSVAGRPDLPIRTSEVPITFPR